MVKAGLIAIQEKPCGRKKRRKKRKKEKKYPACRPTMAQCTSCSKKEKKGPKAISWKDGRVKKRKIMVVL